jgi:hypothetical protein
VDEPLRKVKNIAFLAVDDHYAMGIGNDFNQ